MKIIVKYYYRPITGTEVDVRIEEENDLDKIIETINKIVKGVK